MSTITWLLFLFEQHYVINLKISGDFIPFLPFLEATQKFLTPSGPKLIYNVLHPSPPLSSIQIWGFESSRCGMTILDFTVNRLDGDKGKGRVTLLMVSTVNGLEFTTTSASAISVWRDSSSRLLWWVKINLADLICLSQTSHIWLAAGGFLSQIIQSALSLQK